jgi:hypothetical protein
MRGNALLQGVSVTRSATLQARIDRPGCRTRVVGPSWKDSNLGNCESSNQKSKPLAKLQNKLRPRLRLPLRKDPETILHSSPRILVGARGFEPPTTCTPCRYATRLRYAPKSRSISDRPRRGQREAVRAAARRERESNEAMPGSARRNRLPVDPRKGLDAWLACASKDHAHPRRPGDPRQPTSL